MLPVESSQSTGLKVGEQQFHVKAVGNRQIGRSSDFRSCLREMEAAIEGTWATSLGTAGIWLYLPTLHDT